MYNEENMMCSSDGDVTEYAYSYEALFRYTESRDIKGNGI